MPISNYTKFNSSCQVQNLVFKLCSLSHFSIVSHLLQLPNRCTGRLHKLKALCNLFHGILRPVSRTQNRAFCTIFNEARCGRVAVLEQSMEAPDSISYLTKREAAEIDDTLMGPLGFSVDQLMELAGLSVATSIAQVYKPTRITVNPFLSVEDLSLDLSKDFDVIIDAMFGFSFYGTPRPQRLVSLHNSDQVDKERSVIISIDIPSGWHVEEGDVHGEGIKPDILVSLTAPKLYAKKFSGTHHFLGALRENYISPEFLEEQVEVDPIKQFYKWFDNALTAGLREPNAMALSKVGKDGKPSSRMVLLKGIDKDGFVWYTNYDSCKARELSENPHASLIFYWDGPNSHVRVEGSVQKVSEEESEQYFHSRPRGSQIASSTVVPGRLFLYQECEELDQKFADGLRYSSYEIDEQLAWKVERLAP